MRRRQPTRVTVDIVPQGSGCELTLTQEGVLPEYVSRTESGWTTILHALAATLGQANESSTSR